MRTSSKMGLRIWDNLLDNYDHEQLADNWAKVDAHDHTNGRGVLIPTEGLADAAKFTSVISDTGWITPPLINSWANLVTSPARLPVAYRRKGTIVYLQGSLWGGAFGQPAFVLPAGFRPTAAVFAASAGYTTTASFTSVLVLANGEVQIYWPTSSTQAAIDGVSFTTD